MKYEAVIFDLFGTLIPMMSSGDYKKVLTQMASVLSVPFDDLVRLWRSTFDQRMKGDFRTHQDCIGHICEQLGVSVENSQIEAAAQIRFHMNRREVMTLRPDAIKVLSHLKLKGYKIGLISNCAFETTTFWKELPLASLIDIAIFSCLVGMMKPNPRIYELATKQLSVKPQDCLYVADGIGQELSTASQLGMHAAQISMPGEDEDDPYREDWEGPIISSLTEVLTLLE
jgi:putative hydrolase of the HAD superfamily